MKKQIFTFIIAVIITANAFGQWITYTNTYNSAVFDPASTLSATGIGNFSTAGLDPSARLHVNNFYCTSPTSGLNGLLFRTDGDSTVLNRWQLYTGLTAGTVNEKFALFVPANSNNTFLQTTQNGHMFYNTNSTMREKMNADYTAASQYAVNGWNGTTIPSINTSGYVGIGSNDILAPASAGHLWTDKGPFSLLHLNGGNYHNVQEVGFRPWMKIGMTVTSNDDLMYVGHKKIANDVTDAVFAWSDNNSNLYGPDNMVFLFTRNTGLATGADDDLGGWTMDGREIMRLTAIGNVGIGPRFNNNAQPQSMLHINGQNDTSVYLQITNTTWTGQTAFDGFKLGINTIGVAQLQQ